MIRIDENSGQVPSEQLMQDMGKLIEEMTREGASIHTAGLRPTAEGVRVRLRKGQLSSVDYVFFTETKEAIGGFAIVEAPSMREAVELTRRFLRVHGDTWNIECEVRQMEGPDCGTDFEGETRRAWLRRVSDLTIGHGRRTVSPGSGGVRGGGTRGGCPLERVRQGDQARVRERRTRERHPGRERVRDRSVGRQESARHGHARVSRLRGGGGECSPRRESPRNSRTHPRPLPRPVRPCAILRAIGERAHRVRAARRRVEHVGRFEYGLAVP